MIRVWRSIGSVGTEQHIVALWVSVLGRVAIAGVVTTRYVLPVQRTALPGPEASGMKTGAQAHQGRMNPGEHSQGAASRLVKKHPRQAMPLEVLRSPRAGDWRGAVGDRPHQTVENLFLHPLGTH